MEDNIDTNKMDYEIMPEGYNQYDLSFKIIVVGDTGKIKIKNFRCGKIMSDNERN
jgi:hypothetical protein